MSKVEMDWQTRWPHFSPEEILSPSLLKVYNNKGVYPFSFSLLDTLEAFRGWLQNKHQKEISLHVNQGRLKRRGVRGIRDLASVYGLKKLAHADQAYTFHFWCGCDVSTNVKDLSISELRKDARECELWKGVGWYNSFVHLDMRDGPKAFWDFTSKETF